MASFTVSDQGAKALGSSRFSSSHRKSSEKVGKSWHAATIMHVRGALAAICFFLTTFTLSRCEYHPPAASSSGSSRLGQAAAGFNSAAMSGNSDRSFSYNSDISGMAGQPSNLENGSGGILNFLKHSKLWVGVQSGYNNAQANFLTNGFVAGGSVEIIFDHFGIWGSLMTGQSGTKTHDLQTAQYSVALKEGGTVGVLTGSAGISYYYDLLPKVAISLGAGVQYSTYNTSYVTMGPAYALSVVPGISYEISRSWGIGLQVPVSSTSVTRINANGNPYDLTSKEQALMTQFLFVFKYRLN